MNFAILPPQASELARHIDTIFLGLVVVSVIISLAVLITGTVFAVRYRKGSPAKRGQLPEWVSREVEVTWTVATLFSFIFVFWFAASAFVTGYRAPPGALEIHVVGKQWMWKVEHPSGAREINELHVPVDVPVRLVLTSQDVIHSFFLPALRIKQDAVPGRYTSTSFKADRTGNYDLFCAEYCGRGHAIMGGRLIVESQTGYQQWASDQQHVNDLAGEGRELFTRMGCAGCHEQNDHTRAPNLAGLYGSYVELADGRTIRADEAYLTDSILEPRKDVVAGYDPIMPSFRDALTDGELFRIIAYLKTFSGDGETP
jgi:cytochrome c oxidase subunit 2